MTYEVFTNTIKNRNTLLKKAYTILGAILLTTSVFAQAPEKMSYQAVVRNSGDNLVTSQPVGMQISILQTSATGTEVYVETQTPTTNVNGLVTLEIGTGVVVVGDFKAIDWSSGPYFIKTETDPTGGTNYTITGTSQLLSVPYALHSKTAENTFSGDYNDLSNQPNIPTVTTYAVGDFAKGGIVFWVDETSQHGLVCAKEDQNNNVRWYAGTNGNTQAKGDGIYAGKANTSIIIATQVAIGDDTALYAARICNELQITEDGITYGDWYLPSIYELNLMYVNRATINTTATANGGTDFTGFYWSSTESTNTNARFHNFNIGVQGTYLKSFSYSVRAVRAF